MRPHTASEAAAVLDEVDAAREVFTAALGRPMVHAADEYYLLAARPFPPASAYDGFGMHEDGIGMARAFEMEFHGEAEEGIGVQPGFFDWVDGAPAEGYRAPRTAGPGPTPVRLGRRRGVPVAILTSVYGAAVLQPLVDDLGRHDVRVVTVRNDFFGGNIGVAGLMVGDDLARALEREPAGHRYLLPDVCLSRGVFLDGSSPEDLPRPVEVVPTDGVALRRALEQR
jgi:NifB/MoaA-like Fe-S oxidoreductase